MIDPLEAHVAELILGMRTPLSRVELAATQLARSTITPAAKGLAQGISDAVSQLDERIADALDMLGRVCSPTQLEQDCSDVLIALRERMGPVLRARSVEWQKEQLQRDARPLVGDRAEVTQAALLMLQAGTDLAGAGGRMSLTLDCESGGLGLGLHAERASGVSESSPVDAEAILAEVSEFARVPSRRLAHFAESQAFSATLCLGVPKGSRCDA